MSYQYHLDNIITLREEKEKADELFEQNINDQFEAIKTRAIIVADFLFEHRMVLNDFYPERRSGKIYIGREVVINHDIKCSKTFKSFDKCAMKVEGDRIEFGYYDSYDDSFDEFIHFPGTLLTDFETIKPQILQATLDNEVKKEVERLRQKEAEFEKLKAELGK